MCVHLRTRAGGYVRFYSGWNSTVLLRTLQTDITWHTNNLTIPSDWKLQSYFLECQLAAHLVSYGHVTWSPLLGSQQ